MAKVYIEARPKGRQEGTAIEDYVVEEQGDRVLKIFKTQAEAITWSKSEGDLPLNFHPAAIRASAGFTPWGAGGATCDRRSWSGLRRRSRV
ncbi:MAG: hypothetical protein WAN05_14800, partial [Roseiarcus sp.]